MNAENEEATGEAEDITMTKIATIAMTTTETETEMRDLATND